MTVPPGLLDALAELATGPGLAAAAARVSARYRADGGLGGDALGGDDERLAYALVRMPATTAAVAAALSACPARPWRSLLDLGAGCGAGAWAAAWRLPQLVEATAVERDPGLIALGRHLAADIAWRPGDLLAPPELPTHDLVLFSYSLGELPEDARDDVLAWAWERTGDALLLVEPGTPRGAAGVLAARDRLLALGARIAAPCPHERACPLPAHGWSWCHTAVRLPRSRVHRQLKGAALGWEEERFSWLLAVRDGPPGPARVLAPPERADGGIALLLCETEGVRRRVVRRREADWPAARRAGWGDAWLSPAAAPPGGSAPE